MEDLLESTRLPLRVLVVWEPVIRTDVAPPTTGTLARISDPRAIQYWDRDRLLSTYLMAVARANPSWLRSQDRERVMKGEYFIIWVVALTFPAGSRWESTLPPPSYYGGPVVQGVDAIRGALGER